MYARLRFLKVANVLLYLGPLFAGMAGLGWGIVAPFVAIFALWLMTVRPEQWPSSWAEWLTGRALGAALTQVLSQLLLVTVLIGLGRGIVGLAGISPTVNPLIPLCMSLTAIFLSRVVWDARGAAAEGVYLDDEAQEAGSSQSQGNAQAAVAPLLALADDLDEAGVRDRVEQVLSGPGAHDRLAALTASLLAAGRGHAALRRAVVIWATEPEIVAPGQVPNALFSSFALSDGDPDLLRLFLPRALALAGAFPDRAAGFPSPATLRAAAKAGLATGPDTDIPDDLRADLGDGLLALARSVETALTRSRAAPDASVDPAPHAADLRRAPRPV